MALGQNQKISFIPKRSFVKGAETERRPISMLLFGAVILLIVVWGIYGGLYVYANSIESSIKEKETQIQAFQSSFNKPLIAQAQTLQKKISLAGSVVQNHIAVAPIFSVLEKGMTSNSYIEKFEFTNEKDAPASAPTGTDSALSSPYKISITARTPSFAAAADLENALESQTDAFSGVIVGGTRLDPATGQVDTDFSIGLKPEFVAFIQSGQAAATTATTSQTQTASTTQTVVPPAP